MKRCKKLHFNMIVLVVNIFINLLLLFYPLEPAELGGKNNILEIDELEETVNLPLTKILSDILSDYNAHNQNNKNIFVVGITKSDQAIRVNVHYEASGKIDDEIDPLGYIKYGGNIIIIMADNWLLEDGFTKIPEIPDKINVLTEFRHPGIIYDPDSWSYLVREGNFSRYVDGIGWEKACIRLLSKD